IEGIFLMGVYRADGNPTNFEKNRFKLSGQTGDEQFYKEIVQELIKKTFNLKEKTIITPRERSINKKKYTWNDVYIEIISQGHFEYLLDYINIFNNKKEFQPLNIECIGETKKKIAEYQTAYLMGMIAAGGNMRTRSNDRLILTMQDTGLHFIPETERMMQEHPEMTYSRSKTKPYLHFNQKTIESMVAYDPGFRISEEQLGMFVNPKQISMIEQQGIRQI
ncbi:MAG: hypothetical protein KKF89_00715, partial [Nanoarchaeota archaeon]|nr:hypothetical protein [Nanoarchaeota archaeon]